MVNEYAEKPFQLTTSRRGRRDRCRRICRYSNFNSRPHEEVDCRKGVNQMYSDISTHDLTKRSTVTSPTCTLPYLVFQLTTSRRGRRFYILVTLIFYHFNSRPHEEVDDRLYFICFSDEIFQLTTSRRGRLKWEE